MRELAERVLGAEEAWVVGGAVRDELLGRPVVDLDIACADPLRAARAYAKQSGGAPFPLSERHGAWRVALDEGRTVDFTPLRGTIEDDLATRDFTVNAIAVPLSGGEAVDPFGGRRDLEELSLRHVTTRIFEDDPLRLLRAVRFVDQFGFRLVEETTELIRASAHLAAQPAGERILAELEQLSVAGFRLLDELELLQHLGGSVAELQDADSAAIRLPRVFGKNLERFPLSNDQRRLLRTVLRAERPADDSARQIHRFRRATEPGPSRHWIPRRAGARARSSRRPAAASRPSRSCAATSSASRPGPEVGRLLEPNRGGAGSGHDLHPRGGARAGRARAAVVTLSAQFRHTSARVSPLGSQRGGGRANRTTGRGADMTETDAVRRRFAVTAAQLGRLTDERADALRERVRRFVPLTGEERALDSGTGTGALAFALSGMVREVVAVDTVRGAPRRGPEARVRDVQCRLPRGRCHGAAFRRRRVRPRRVDADAASRSAA